MIELNSSKISILAFNQKEQKKKETFTFEYKRYKYNTNLTSHGKEMCRSPQNIMGINNGCKVR